jgi:hypothetical protein
MMICPIEYVSHSVVSHKTLSPYSDLIIDGSRFLFKAKFNEDVWSDKETLEFLVAWGDLGSQRDEVKEE